MAEPRPPRIDPGIGLPDDWAADANKRKRQRGSRGRGRRRRIEDKPANELSEWEKRKLRAKQEFGEAFEYRLKSDPEKMENDYKLPEELKTGMEFEHISIFHMGVPRDEGGFFNNRTNYYTEIEFDSADGSGKKKMFVPIEIPQSKTRIQALNQIEPIVWNEHNHRFVVVGTGDERRLVFDDKVVEGDDPDKYLHEYESGAQGRAERKAAIKKRTDSIRTLFTNRYDGLKQPEERMRKNVKVGKPVNYRGANLFAGERSGDEYPHDVRSIWWQGSELTMYATDHPFANGDNPRFQYDGFVMEEVEMVSMYADYKELLFERSLEMTQLLDAYVYQKNAAGPEKFFDQMVAQIGNEDIRAQVENYMQLAKQYEEIVLRSLEQAKRMAAEGDDRDAMNDIREKLRDFGIQSRTLGDQMYDAARQIEMAIGQNAFNYPLLTSMKREDMLNFMHAEFSASIEGREDIGVDIFDIQDLMWAERDIIGKGVYRYRQDAGIDRKIGVLDRAAPDTIPPLEMNPDYVAPEGEESTEGVAEPAVEPTPAEPVTGGASDEESTAASDDSTDAEPAGGDDATPAPAPTPTPTPTPSPTPAPTPTPRPAPAPGPTPAEPTAPTAAAATPVEGSMTGPEGSPIEYTDPVELPAGRTMAELQPPIPGMPYTAEGKRVQFQEGYARAIIESLAAEAGFTVENAGGAEPSILFTWNRPNHAEGFVQNATYRMKLHADWNGFSADKEAGFEVYPVSGEPPVDGPVMSKILYHGHVLRAAQLGVITPAELTVVPPVDAEEERAATDPRELLDIEGELGGPTPEEEETEVVGDAAAVREQEARAQREAFLAAVPADIFSEGQRQQLLEGRGFVIDGLRDPEGNVYRIQFNAFGYDFESYVPDHSIAESVSFDDPFAADPFQNFEKVNVPYKRLVPREAFITRDPQISALFTEEEKRAFAAAGTVVLDGFKEESTGAVHRITFTGTNFAIEQYKPNKRFLAAINYTDPSAEMQLKHLTRVEDEPYPEDLRMTMIEEWRSTGLFTAEELEQLASDEEEVVISGFRHKYAGTEDTLYFGKNNFRFESTDGSRNGAGSLPKADTLLHNYGPDSPTIDEEEDEAAARIGNAAAPSTGTDGEIDGNVRTGDDALPTIDDATPIDLDSPTENFGNTGEVESSAVETEIREDGMMTRDEAIAQIVNSGLMNEDEAKRVAGSSKNRIILRDIGKQRGAEFRKLTIVLEKDHFRVEYGDDDTADIEADYNEDNVFQTLNIWLKENFIPNESAQLLFSDKSSPLQKPADAVSEEDADASADEEPAEVQPVEELEEAAASPVEAVEVAEAATAEVETASVDAEVAEATPETLVPIELSPMDSVDALVQVIEAGASGGRIQIGSQEYEVASFIQQLRDTRDAIATKLANSKASSKKRALTQLLNRNTSAFTAKDGLRDAIKATIRADIENPQPVVSEQQPEPAPSQPIQAPVETQPLATTSTEIQSAPPGEQSVQNTVQLDNSEVFDNAIDGLLEDDNGSMSRDDFMLELATEAGVLTEDMVEQAGSIQSNEVFGIPAFTEVSSGELVSLDFTQREIRIVKNDRIILSYPYTTEGVQKVKNLFEGGVLEAGAPAQEPVQPPAPGEPAV